jgi:hypothetical protein
MPRMTGLIAGMVYLLGCSNSATEASLSTSTSTSTSTETQTMPQPETVTWYADVSPIMQQNCTRCHSEGSLGTGDFTDYTTSAAMAEIMLSRIDAGLMPPPASDPTCRDYHGSEVLTMADDARDTLSAWINAGTPEGDPASAVQIIQPSEVLTNPDLEILQAAPYTPVFNQNGNEYRCFILTDVPEDDYFITAMAPIIGQPSIVHHAVLSTAHMTSLTSAHLAPEGFDCYYGDGGLTNLMLAAWGPGMLPLELPEGVGFAMNGGDALILNVHYFDPGNLKAGIADQSGYAFRTTESVDTEAYVAVWGPTDIAIPADVESYTQTQTIPVLEPGSGWDLNIYSLWPHMHVLGSAYSAASIDTNGEDECIVYSDTYSFENQYTYAFTEPFVSKSGSSLEFKCTWNNSSSNPNLINDPPVPTYYGNDTDDEMCFFVGVYSYTVSELVVDVGEVIAGAVTPLRSEEDLDLDGEVVYAVNYGGWDVQVADVLFTGAISPGSVSSLNVPDLDDDPYTWSGIEDVAYYNVYNLNPDSLLVDFIVEPGTEYRLQLIIYEPYYVTQGYRRINLIVNGEMVVRELDTHTTTTAKGLVYTLDLTAEDDLLTIEVEGASSGDQYSILNGLTLEANP